MRARVWIVLGPVLMAALATGIGLRLSGLRRKVLWHDEVATYLSLTGHTREELSALADGRPTLAADLRRFLAPGADLGAGAALRALAAVEPQSPPFFFILARFAVRLLGEVGPRAVSAGASIAALMFIGLLARALFEDAGTGWLAVALAAVSPLHVRYGQEARPYALWSLAALAASILLLRALRRGHRRDWLAYALAAAAALYVHLLSALVLAAHALYAAWWLSAGKAARGGESARRHRATRPAAAFGAALLLFAPWAAVLSSHRGVARADLAWTQDPLTLAALGRRWVGIVTTVFLRSGDEGGLLGASGQWWVMAARFGLSLSVLFLLAVCGCALVRRAPREAWVFVVLLGAVPALCLVVPDLVWGGRRSMIPRFFVPLWIALELCVAGALGLMLRREGLRAAVGAATASALLLAGAASAWRAAPQRTWWDTDPPALRAMMEAARLINAGSSATVLTDAPPFWVLVLLHEVRDETTFRLFRPEAVAAAEDLEPSGSDVFLYRPSPTLLRVAREVRPSLRPCAGTGDVQLWCAGPRGLTAPDEGHDNPAPETFQAFQPGWASSPWVTR
jgi:uncharacterized membrane protein